MADDKKRLARVGAGWVRKTQDGRELISLSLDVPLVIDPTRWEMVLFEVKDKVERGPDFDWCISPRQERADRDFEDRDPGPRREAPRAQATSGRRGFDDDGDKGDPFADEDRPRRR